MKKTEIILAFAALAAIVLRLLAIEGGVLLSTAAFGLLALFYLLLSIPFFNQVPLNKMLSKAVYREQQGRTARIIWALATGIVLFCSLLGILFVLNHWEGASVLWRSGMFLMVPVAAVSLIKNMLETSAFHKAIAIRGGIVLLVGIAAVVLQL